MSTMWVEKKIHDKDYEKAVKDRRAGKTDVQIGKKGLTKGLIEEIRRRLEAEWVVKVRMLKSFINQYSMNRKELAAKVAEKVGARLLEVRGYTFILVRSKIKYRRFRILGEERGNNYSRDKKWLQR